MVAEDFSFKMKVLAGLQLEKQSQKAPFCSGVAPCKGVEDSLGFWLPRRGFGIPGT